MTTYFAIFSSHPLVVDTPASRNPSTRSPAVSTRPLRLRLPPNKKKPGRLLPPQRRLPHLRDPSPHRILLKLEGIELEEQSSAATAKPRYRHHKKQVVPRTSSKRPSNSTCSSKRCASQKKW